IDGAQEGRLTAPRRPNQRRDRPRLDHHVDIVQRLLGPVPERELPGSDRARMLVYGRRVASARCRSRVVRHDASHPKRPVMYDSVRSSLGLVNIVSVGATSISSPPRKNAVWSETRPACCKLCVTITTVTSVRSSYINSSTFWVLIGSSDAVGSSRRITSGCVAR